MPFTKKEDRNLVLQVAALQEELSRLKLTLKPGDLCFNHYRQMMEKWLKAQKWTTVDELAAPLFQDPEARAYFLAFLVFFAFQALPYERKKKEENGDIN